MVITSGIKVFKHEVSNTTIALTSRYSNGCHKNVKHKAQPTHNGKARIAISQVKENWISIIIIIIKIKQLGQTRCVGNEIFDDGPGCKSTRNAPRYLISISHIKRIMMSYSWYPLSQQN